MSYTIRDTAHATLFESVGDLLAAVDAVAVEGRWWVRCYYRVGRLVGSYPSRDGALLTAQDHARMVAGSWVRS